MRAWSVHGCVCVAVYEHLMCSVVSPFVVRVNDKQSIQQKIATSGAPWSIFFIKPMIYQYSPTYLSLSVSYSSFCPPIH